MPAITNRDSLKIRNIYRDEKSYSSSTELLGYYNTDPDLSFLKTKINETNKAMDKELFNSSAVEISSGVTSN